MLLTKIIKVILYKKTNQAWYCTSDEDPKAEELIVPRSEPAAITSLH